MTLRLTLIPSPADRRPRRLRLLTLFLGNLGTIQMIYQKLQQIGRRARFELGVRPFPSSSADLGDAGILPWLLKGTPLAYRTRGLVLEPEPRRPAAGRQRDHRVPAVHFPLQRPACAYDRHAAGAARLELGARRRGGTRQMAQPLVGCAGICRRRSDHRRVVSIQPIGYLHISSRGAGRAGICYLALRRCAHVLPIAWDWSLGQSLP